MAAGQRKGTKGIIFSVVKDHDICKVGIERYIFKTKSQTVEVGVV